MMDDTATTVPAAIDASGYRGLDAYAVSSFGIRIAEVRIFSPTPAMIIVGVTASPPVR
jgi:hypothetical protein